MLGLTRNLGVLITGLLTAQYCWSISVTHGGLLPRQRRQSAALIDNLRHRLKNIASASAT